MKEMWSELLANTFVNLLRRGSVACFCCLKICVDVTALHFLTAGFQVE